MRKSVPVILGGCAVLVGGIILSTAGGSVLNASGLETAASAQSGGLLPPNPQTTNCSLSQSEFDSWIADGQGSLPVFWAADSVGFPQDNTKCDFYKWSSQMFLWITSPAAAEYGADRLVLDSPVFFDVGPSTEDDGRTLYSNAGGANNFQNRTGKFDEAIRETGQAGGGDALISQHAVSVSRGSSLVYYGVHVNDVYAYFALGNQAGRFTPDPQTNFPNDFPTSQADLTQIETFAESQSVALQSPWALSMELKTSWVDASTLEDPAQYLTISATVPNFNRDSDQIWRLDTDEPTIPMQLALVGMHVVGTVQGHPEMVWATFEHVNNGPDVPYQYVDSDGNLQTAGGLNQSAYLFNASSMDPANIAFLKDCDTSHQPPGGCSAGDLVATPGQDIGASNTTRMNPWGNPGVSEASSDVPDNNAQLISLNTDVIGFLGSEDARRNYVQVGAVWTRGGGLPVYNNLNVTGDAQQVGSLTLANMTMETYHQGSSAGVNGCFSCHGVSSGDTNGVDVSHIYSAIEAANPMIMPMPDTSDD